MADQTTLHPEDVYPVRSRISWGAIFAGAMVFLALYFLFSLLGTALGLSISDNVRSDQLGTGAIFWAIVSILVSLFLGGWVTTQCTAGENKLEAVVYGVVLWGLTFAMLLWFTVSGMRLGFNAMMGMAAMASNNRDMINQMTPADWNRIGKEAGLSQEQIDRFRAQMPTSVAELRQAAEDPEVHQRATMTAWWTFFGTLFSMIAAIGGALAGAGPSLVFRPLAVRTTTTSAAFPTR